MIDAFPLSWPVGRPRTPRHRQERARFGARIGSRNESGGGSRPLTVDAALSRLKHQIKLLNASQLVVSSNLALRRDGLPRSGQGEPADCGIAVYFRINQKPYVVSCDRWDRVADNIAAIAAHLDAMRGQDRWGCGTLEQAFAGYKALPAQQETKPWWQVLGFVSCEPPSFNHAKSAYRLLAAKYHPDTPGGDLEKMKALNEAYQQAADYFGV